MRTTHQNTRWKYTAGIFGFLLLYAFAIVNRFSLPHIDGIAYSFHLLDFSLGFCSRFLPGALYHLFVKEPSQLSAAVYETALLVIFFIPLSYMLAVFMEHVPEKYRPAALTLLALYLTGSCTFAPYSCALGMLDVYWIYFSLIYIAAIPHKVLRWLLCPVLLFLCTMIHYGVIITYIPFLCLLTLYETAAEPDKKEKIKKTVLLVLCIAVSVGGFAYFLTHDKQNINCSIAEFHNMLEENGVGANSLYYDAAFFATPENYTDEFVELVVGPQGYDGSPYTPVFDGENLSGIQQLINGLAYQLQYQYFLFTNREIYKDVLIEAGVLLLVLLPLLVMFYRFARRGFTEARGNGLLRLTWFCVFFLFPLAAFVSLLISTDSVRWTAHGFLCLFTFSLYVLRREPDKWETLREYLFSFSPVLRAAYFGIYALLILDPYV